MNPDRFTFVALFLIVMYLVGMPIAIFGGIPAQFDTSGESTNLVRDAFTTGTGISAPFFLLVLLAAFTLLAQRRDRWGVAGTVGGVLIGLLFTIGTLGELVAVDAFTGIKRVVFLGWNAVMLPFTLSLVVFGIRNLVRRRSRGSRPLGA